MQKDGEISPQIAKSKANFASAHGNIDIATPLELLDTN